MKKKIFALILIIVLIFSGCAPQNKLSQNNSDNSLNSDNTYVKSVWITYYELESFIKNSGEEKFAKNIKNAFNNIKEFGFNTVTVQVRPCADAFYMSDYFPSSKYCFGIQGADMAYDPLKIMCDTAKQLGLRIEAWINPYRVSQDNKINSLCNDNMAKKWYKNKKNKSNVYITKNAIYFNPASKKVVDLIVNGVREIVEKYSVDAIHFDDYFYPTTNKDIDKKEYNLYIKNGGTLNLANWRRENVDNMVKSVYSAVKTANKNVLFGISPASNVDENYSKLYANVKKWAGEEGYVDYICPQIYFGFKNENQPFMFTAKKWLLFSKRDLYIGLPLYKCGKSDKYASSDNKAAINEFKNNDNIISRQITYISKIEDIKGYYVFSYSSLIDENNSAETENMKAAMQNSNPD